MTRQLWMVVGVLGLVGCATIFPPETDRVLLQSQPPGATVSINGEVRGVTPLSVPLLCQPVPIVRMELRGYEVVEHPMPRREVWDHRLVVMAWPVEKCAETFAVVLRPQGAGR